MLDAQGDLVAQLHLAVAIDREFADMAFCEAGLIFFLCLWAGACVCYAFSVPRIHVFLNRHNRFGMFASWAVATSNNIHSSPGAHSVEFCDFDSKGNSAGWKRAASSDYWVWHAFLWFPGKIEAFRLQGVGREIGVFSQARPPATRMIEEHGIRLLGFVSRMYPLAPGTARRVRLLQRVMIDGKELERVVWRSADAANAAFC